MTSRQRVTVGLPAELTSFVGRDHELAEVRKSLGIARLLTVTGVGGVGKTRLALRVAATVARRFADGVVLIELAGLDEPGLLADRVATAVGLDSDSTRQAWQDLEVFFADRRMLVVLDNCEHLLDACAAFAERLLPRSRSLHILATSRQPLGLASERVFRLAPLETPDWPTVGRPASLERYDGIALFVDRARASLPGFGLTDDNAAHVAAICQKLDGIPLALELAASRLGTYSPAQLVELISDRFAVLTAASPSVPSRHRTLRTSIDWSFELCTEQERALWSRLSVFAGGFELAAAQAVCSGDDVDSRGLPDVIAELVDKSIVVRTEQDGHSRFHMLETIRQYGQDHLREAGELREFGRRHFDWCRRLIAEPDAGIEGLNQLGWFTRLWTERPNLQAAMSFGRSEDDGGFAAIDFAVSLCLDRRGVDTLGQARRWLDYMLERVPQASPARAKALWTYAWLALLQGNSAAARTLLAECRSVADAIDDELALAHVIQFSALADLYEGNAEAAVIGFVDALDRHMRLGVAESHRFVRLQLMMARSFAGDPMTDVHLCRTWDSLRDRPVSLGAGYVWWIQAVREVVSGDPRQAATPAANALRIGVDAGDPALMWLTLETIGWSVCASGDYRRAARLLGAAESIRDRFGSTLSGYQHVLPHHQTAVRLARERLDAASFQAAYRAGSALTEEEAVALGLGEHDSPQAAATATEPSLTPRQRVVAELVAEGLSNQEIASRLLISRRTVAGHVGNIFATLGFTSRAQIAAWATQLSLVMRSAD